MPILIDGNNLLFAACDAEPDHPPGRAKLCERIGAWSRRYGETVTVIFDGAEPDAAIASQIGDPDVEVCYSGVGIKADDVLIERIHDCSAPRRLVVVSTDREIARSARRRRARPLKSAAFWELLLEDLARPLAEPLEPLEKRHGLASLEETDRWMQELGIEDDRDDEFDSLLGW
ncbi:MAG: NYN domain-containing protein [Planctomycetes bacterium]|nr:NYN domain-containing protein [Planctomycetota bacterium]